ncbi:MAG: hypothetical protein N3B10_14855 [Armatimonadetes bacterium]|nr:hypothetical protein [Armatimonadota bacterium]
MAELEGRVEGDVTVTQTRRVGLLLNRKVGKPEGLPSERTER